MRLVFMGTPDFSVPALEALHREHEIAAVYCQPPRPAGRGKADRKGAVHARAEQLGLQVRHPVSLRDADALREFVALQVDVAVVVAYGLILPQAALDAPRLGCLNIHASLLPRWRGAAPIQRAIMAGDAQTGISIMQMAAGLDTGPVLRMQQMAIGAGDTSGDLHLRLSAMGAEMISQVLADLPQVAQPQPDAGVTYAAKVSKAEAQIDFTLPAAQVDCQIRGLSPFPGAFVQIGPERVKLLRSRVVAGAGAPGMVLHGFTIACGEGAIEVLEAQREGKRPLPAAEVLNGLRLSPVL